MTSNIKIQKIIDKCAHDLDSVDIFDEDTLNVTKFNIINESLHEVITIYRKYEDKTTEE